MKLKGNMSGEKRQYSFKALYYEDSKILTPAEPFYISKISEWKGQEWWEREIMKQKNKTK